MKGRFKTRVLENRRLCGDIFQLKLGLDGEQSFNESDIRPGQFFNLYLEDEAHLLPRPISVCDVKDGELCLVFRSVGYGTGVFSRLKEGDFLWVLGSLGNGYPIDSLNKNSTILAVGGGLGVPPMLYLTKTLKKEGFSIEVLAGFRDEAFLTEEFDSVGARIHIVSDSGNAGIKGTVIDGLKALSYKPDIILSCGPLPMLSALKSYTAKSDIELYVSLEERMACGIGACLGCVCETTGLDSHSLVHNSRVCKDGPVFDAREVVL